MAAMKRNPKPILDVDNLDNYTSLEQFANAVDDLEYPVKDKAVEWAAKVLLQYMTGKRPAMSVRKMTSGLFVRLVDGISVYRRDIRSGHKTEEWYAEVDGKISYISSFAVKEWPEVLKEALVRVYKNNKEVNNEN